MISNNPPPEATFSMAIDDLYDEAKNFIDGTPIENQGQADAIGKIVSELKAIKKAADAARADEKRPHDDAAKAVQAKWKPLLDKANRAIDAAEKPVTVFLLAAENKRRAEAQRLADEAAKAAQQAQEAQRNAASLDDAERADELAKEAAKLDKAARRTDKAKSNVAGVNRAIGLRTYWKATITDATAFARWAWKHRNREYMEFLNTLAANEARQGVVIDGLKMEPLHVAA